MFASINLRNFRAARMTEHSDSDCFVHLLHNSQGVTFLLTLFHKTLCAAIQLEVFDHIIPNFLQN